MSLSIHTNVSSQSVQRNLHNVTERMQGHFARLSSGLRIATAADDASGLALSERMRADIRSMAVAERNVQDGISLARTAEGILSEVHELLGRVKELALTALSGTLGTADRTVVDTEFRSVTRELFRITNDAEYAGRKLLANDYTIEIQAGIDPDATIEIGITNVSFFGPVLEGHQLVTGTAEAEFVNTLVDSYVDRISTLRGEFGAAENRLSSALRSMRTARENVTAAESRIRDVDVAEETAALTRDSILQQVGVSMLAQANLEPALAILLI